MRAVADHLIRDVDVAAPGVVRGRRATAPTRATAAVDGGVPRRPAARRQRRLVTTVDRRDEAVAAAMRGLDEARRLRVVAKRAADLAHADLERGIADEHPGPDGVHELVLGHQPAGVLGQVLQHAERFRRQRDRHAVMEQRGAPEVQGKVAEDQCSRRCGGVKRHLDRPTRAQDNTVTAADTRSAMKANSSSADWNARYSNHLAVGFNTRRLCRIFPERGDISAVSGHSPFPDDRGSSRHVLRPTGMIRPDQAIAQRGADAKSGRLSPSAKALRFNLPALRCSRLAQCQARQPRKAR